MVITSLFRKVRIVMQSPAPSHSDGNNNGRATSPLVEFWAWLYNSTPKLCVPKTEFAVGLTLYSTLFFWSVLAFYRAVYTSSLVGFPGFWESPKTAAICSGSASLTHSLIIIPTTFALLRCQPYVPSATMEGKPKVYLDATTAILQFCSGYMLYDFSYMVMMGTAKFAWVAHHFGTVLYMSQVRVLRAGHVSALMAMFSGELTNPLQNLHGVTRLAVSLMRDDDSSLWHAVHPYVEYAYAVKYIVVRGVICHFLIWQIARDMFSREGRRNISPWITVPWVLILEGITLGSFPWVSESLEMIMDGMHVKYDKHYHHEL